MQLPLDPALEAKPQLTNPPMIMGMMTIEGVRFVQVRPEKAGAEDNSSMRLGEGDKWEGDWVVESIQNDRIVLLAKDTREEVLFHDPGKRRPRKPAPQTAKAGGPGGGGAVLTIGSKPGGAGMGRTASAAPAPPTGDQAPDLAGEVRGRPGPDDSGAAPAACSSRGGSRAGSRARSGCRAARAASPARDRVRIRSSGPIRSGPTSGRITEMEPHKILQKMRKETYGMSNRWLRWLVSAVMAASLTCWSSPGSRALAAPSRRQVRNRRRRPRLRHRRRRRPPQKSSKGGETPQQAEQRKTQQSQPQQKETPEQAKKRQEEMQQRMQRLRRNPVPPPPVAGGQDAKIPPPPIPAGGMTETPPPAGPRGSGAAAAA